MQSRAKSMRKLQNCSVTVNKNRNKRSLERISSDNNVIVKRLRKQNSAYSLAKFEEARKEQEGILQRIGDYPFKVPTYRKSLKSAGKRVKNEIVYMKSLEISNKRFDVEIYKGRTLVILAFDADEMYKLAFSHAEAFEIMKDHTSYEKLTQKLAYENGNLLLID